MLVAPTQFNVFASDNDMSFMLRENGHVQPPSLQHLPKRHHQMIPFASLQYPLRPRMDRPDGAFLMLCQTISSRGWEGFELTWTRRQKKQTPKSSRRLLSRLLKGPPEGQETNKSEAQWSVNGSSVERERKLSGAWIEARLYSLFHWDIPWNRWLKGTLLIPFQNRKLPLI